MENFLTIPWQQEAINKESAIVRGARASGKTTVAIRWAIRQMRQGKSVAFVSGAVSAYYNYNNLKEMLIRELTRQGIEVTYQLFNLITVGQGSVMFLNARSNAPAMRDMTQDCIVLDDADEITINESRNLPLGLQAQYFVTGTKDSGVMSSFLKDEWSPLYLEFNLYHMIEAGFISKNEDWAKWDITPRELKKNYGPWKPKGNKNNKFVLEKYDS